MEGKPTKWQKYDGYTSYHTTNSSNMKSVIYEDKIIADHIKDHKYIKQLNK